MRPVPKLLSKTKLMRGVRCDKCIYLTIHRPDLEPPITPELQALFDQGNAVGAKAREYFPNGVLVDNAPWDFTGAINRTKLLLANKTPVIYEAAFAYAGCYARADILRLNPATERYQIFEVKSSTKLKDEQIDDIGLQVWIMAKAGLPIEQIHLMHLNSACRYPDLSNLFSCIDITATIREHYLSVQPKVRDLLTLLNQCDVPNIDLGEQCFKPTECQFKTHCFTEKSIPELSVFNLPQIKNRKWELYKAGITTLDDPRLTDLTDLQERIVKAHQTNTRFVNETGIAESLKTWQYPFIYLDFETINPAIPRYNGTGPFQQVPFQFSVHRQENPHAPVTHQAFLQTNADDPRPALIPALLAACGTQGSIIAYFAKFESDRIRELAEFAPEFADALLSLLPRMVDPLTILREHVYDPAFGASFSLKRVAPALLGESQSYKGMPVANGLEAQQAFLQVINPLTPDLVRQPIVKAMLDYCEKDTAVMVELVGWLLRSCSASPGFSPSVGEK